MTASSPRTPARTRRLIGIGAAALLAVPASLIMTTPAHAAEAGSETFTSSTASEWTVPAGVREVVVTALGGSGGKALGEHGGAGGFGASVESVLAVEPGNVLTVWAGAAGGDAVEGRNGSGAGGAGYVAGGNGANSGEDARPGAGGGGASAVVVNETLSVIAGGGGGGGGRGADDLGPIDACRGGAGGNAGAAGAASFSNNNQVCSTQAGGAAGNNAAVAGSNASNVSSPTFLQRLLGGSGGGGAGAGVAGAQQTSGLIRTAGGGGGGGGASLGGTVGVASATGNGSVLLEWEVAYTTTLEINSSPAPSVIGETVSFTAYVENVETEDASPVGEIAFDFAGEIVTAPLEATGIANAASATIEVTVAELGTQTVSATYTPTEGSPFAPAASSADYVVEKGDSLTVLDVKPIDPAYFHVVRATATVSVVDPAVSVLDGFVEFFHGDELIDIVAVDPETGEAFVEFTAAEIGEFEVFADYVGDTYLNWSSDVVTYNAHAASTTTTLKASAKEIAHGGKVKFEAAVVSSVLVPVEPTEQPQSGDVTVSATDVEVAAADTPVSPAGVVRFVAGDKVLGEVALSANGTAVFETAELATGSHEVVAHFVSSVPELASSHSEAVKVTVAAAKAGLASTGVDAGLLGGSALLAALLIGLGATVMIRRRQTA